MMGLPGSPAGFALSGDSPRLSVRGSMTTNPPADPQTPPPAALSFEEQMHAFWANNRRQIYVACAVVLLALVAREGWRILDENREADTAAEFARASSLPDKLTAFAATHQGHPLSGIAYLTVADQKFRAGDYSAAADNYTRAQTGLQNEALLGRARLGAAMSRLGAGDRTAGEAALKSIAADASIYKSARAEASYHLAQLAFEAGRYDDVRKLVEDITKVETAGVWAQRALQLRTSLPENKKAAPGTPTVTFTPGKN